MLLHGTGCAVILVGMLQVPMAAVALVDSGALHCFMSETLVAKLELPVLPRDGMEVTLSGRSHVEASKTCLVPLVVYLAH